MKYFNNRSVLLNKSKNPTITLLIFHKLTYKFLIYFAPKFNYKIHRIGNSSVKLHFFSANAFLSTLVFFNKITNLLHFSNDLFTKFVNSKNFSSLKEALNFNIKNEDLAELYYKSTYPYILSNPDININSQYTVEDYELTSAFFNFLLDFFPRPTKKKGLKYAPLTNTNPLLQPKKFKAFETGAVTTLNINAQKVGNFITNFFFVKEINIYNNNTLTNSNFVKTFSSPILMDNLPISSAFVTMATLFLYLAYTLLNLVNLNLWLLRLQFFFYGNSTSIK